MQQSDYQEFVKIYTGSFELLAKGHKMPSEMAVQMFFESIPDITIDQFKKACFEHIRANKWPPDPSDILEIVQGKQEDVEKIEAQNAWEKVNRMIKRFGLVALIGRNGYTYDGHYLPDKIKLEDATARAMKEIGGWDRLSKMTNENHVWIKKEFIEAWGQHETALMIEGPGQNVNGLLENIGNG